jgi:uncharacterized membrane protein
MILFVAPGASDHSSFGPPAAVVYAASSRICHQRSERSFHLAGAQLPVCARCLGLYLSGAIGAVMAWTSRRRPDDRARLVLAVAAIPTAATWAAEVAGLAAFSNVGRALAALPLGLVAGWLCVQMLRYDSHLDGHQVDDRGSRPYSG